MRKDRLFRRPFHFKNASNKRGTYIVACLCFPGPDAVRPRMIRAFEPKDAGALADLIDGSVHRAAISDYSPEQVAVWSPSKPDAERYVQQAVGRILLVAEGADGRIAGYGDVEPNRHIDHLYCRADVIGTGVGSAIYAALESVAINAGIAAVFVEASEGARRLLERRGFIVDGRNDLIIKRCRDP